ncbi:MAG: ribosomal L7Ae/L30e/S12e/Gadd45 family protein [Gemmatimonadota bacterium]|nr:ribosomal L7Ae/L30e/S12e/Gadd45 family protein [Gemmatimonadota bacterium]
MTRRRRPAERLIPLPTDGAVRETKLLGLIGLGLRGGLVVVGAEQVRAAARKGKLAMAVVAPDASRNSLDKVVPLLEARRVRIIRGPAAASLGAAVGRESTAAVGILDRKLADGICRLAETGDGAP